MLQSKSIGVTVNMSGALRALRNSFTGHSNVIVELAQNARRAGASKVTILYDAEAGSLEVSDDGCGVGDMAVLLDVFRSDWGASRPDWSAEDLERESPYGMGMLAALYAAEHITVESAGARFEGDTSDLLNFIPVQVEPFPCTGTRVRLAGIKRLGGLSQLFTGFPIPVELNGVELPRPDAPNEAFKVCPVGTIRVAPLCLGWVAYLQGFRIAGSGRDRCNVIHLDGALFKGNAPDRRVLVDATESRKRIEEAVYAEQIEVVKEMKTAGQLAELVEAFDVLAQLQLTDLLNDIPLLPRKVLAKIEPGTPADVHGTDSSVYFAAHYVMTKAEVEKLLLIGPGLEALDVLDSGDVRMVDCFDSGSDQGYRNDFRDAFNVVQYLAALEVYSVDTDSLDEGHWVHALIKDPGTEVPTITLHGNTAPFDAQGRNFGGKFTAANAIGFDGVFGEVTTIDGYALIDGRLAVAAEFDPNAAVSFFSDYRDEFETDESELKEQDTSLIWAEYTAAISDDPSVLLRNLLGSISTSACDKLAGKSFTVAFDSDGKMTVTAAGK